MPVYETETLEQANAELLRQIEEGLTHSREVIGQIDVIRQLRFTAGGPNALRPHA